MIFNILTSLIAVVMFDTNEFVLERNDYCTTSNILFIADDKITILDVNDEYNPKYITYLPINTRRCFGTGAYLSLDRLEKDAIIYASTKIIEVKEIEKY